MNISADSTINKLILLFVLDKMEIALVEGAVLDICSSRNDWINYMECKEILIDLADVGFIYNINEDQTDEPRYSISYEGRNCLSHFYRRIPLKERDIITDFVKQNRQHFKRSQEYIATHEKTEDGSYKLTLKIKDPQSNKSIFEIVIKAPTKESALSACSGWVEKAPNIYETVFENLIQY